MPKLNAQIQPPVARRKAGAFDRRVAEIDMFFQGTDPVHRTMQRVSEVLDRARISYAIIGGMAVNAHRHQRTTKDVDFLLTSEGLTAFIALRGSEGFEPAPGHARRFIDRQTGVSFDFVITGLFPGSGKPGPIAFPHPDAVSEIIDQKRVINLPRLIELKLAARRHKDFGDVVELIRVHDLSESFADQLHASVRGDFIECLEEKRREDEYEARQDRALGSLHQEKKTDSGSKSE